MDTEQTNQMEQTQGTEFARLRVNFGDLVAYADDSPEVYAWERCQKCQSWWPGLPDKRACFADGAIYSDRTPGSILGHSGRFMGQCPGLTKKEQRILVDISMESAGIPKKFRDRTFENFNATTRELEHALSMARTWAVEQPGLWLYLYGNVGTGKTHLLTAIANLLVDRGHPAPMLVSAPRIVNAMKPNSKVDGEALMNDCCTVKVLLIDEFGLGEARSAFASQKIFDIVNERTMKNLRTAFSSNYTVNEIANFASRDTHNSWLQVQSRIGGRIGGDKGAGFVEVLGDDYRRKGVAK